MEIKGIQQDVIDAMALGYPQEAELVPELLALDAEGWAKYCIGKLIEKDVDRIKLKAVEKVARPARTVIQLT